MSVLSRPRLVAGAACLLVLAGCGATEPGPPAEPSSEAVGVETLEGDTGVIELSGDGVADIETLGIEDFPWDYTSEIACDPPSEDEPDIAQITWAGEMDYVVRQHDDQDAAQDAIRIVAHYDCAKHYDAVDEALG